MCAAVTCRDAYDGKEIRVLDGSDSEPITAVNVDAAGEIIVSGSNDKMVRYWNYDQGVCYNVGIAHSGSIDAVAVTPDGSKIVSIGSEGGIFAWECPAPQ